MIRRKTAPMGERLRVTLIANAGLLLEYQGITLMLDGIYGKEGHPFSNLRPEETGKEGGEYYI